MKCNAAAPGPATPSAIPASGPHARPTALPVSFNAHPGLFPRRRGAA
jgi:hypothetical protein